MRKETRQHTFSVSQRLSTLGLAAFLGMGAMLGAGWYANRQADDSLARISLANDVQDRAMTLHLTGLQLVLAAMDSLVDKGEKAIAPDRLAEINDAAKILRDGSAEMTALVASIGQPVLTEGMPEVVAQLTQAIEVDLKALIETSTDDKAFAAIDDRIDALGSDVEARLTKLAGASGETMKIWVAEAQAQSARAFHLQLFGGILAMALVLGLLYVHGGILRRGILGVRDSMQRIRSGDYTTPVGAVDRGDEIGEMARCVDQFRTSAIDKDMLEREAAQNRSRHDDERRDRERSASEDARLVQVAVNALGEALNRLADGQLTVTIAEPFRADLEPLRLDFNQAVGKLCSVMADMRDNSVSITANGRQMRAAADDLAKRTEQQAASLEQTSAALDEITVTVRTATDKAEEASRMVSETHGNAEESGRIVGQAVAAMARIEDASAEIGKIINVIDEIAFQTNLLALNAGVEAARAGEAGKGFAVVAQEVRELAQRAAGAAKDIKGLVSRSSAEVGTGVRLVQETGDVLGRIGTDIEKINDHMRTIVTAAREQSTGLSEINVAIGQLDQMTQQNAAMVEETNAASHTLAQDAESLSSLIAQFSIGARGGDQAGAGPSSRFAASPSADGARHRPGASAAARPSASAKPASRPAAAAAAKIRPALASARPTASPAKALMTKLTTAFAAPAASSSNDQWEEF